MCLSIAVNGPDKVLSSGEHEGFQWVTVHNGIGYRCGYVRVPKEHPWHGQHYDDIDCSVHGGLTFSADHVPCNEPGPDDSYWVGFDCAHAGDAPDPELPHKVSDDIFVVLGTCGTVRTQEYVETECRKLCEQAAEATMNRKKVTPASVQANGLFGFWKKGWDVECGTCNHTFSVRLPSSTENPSALCPCCNSQNVWSGAAFARLYEKESQI